MMFKAKYKRIFEVYKVNTPEEALEMFMSQYGFLNLTKDQIQVTQLKNRYA